MSVTQRRRERERQELRAGILTAAREIAARDGWQSVTVRKVAEAVEYSPPMIYEYFSSKEAILSELLRLGFAEITEAMVAARTPASTPDRALMEMAQAYWQYAFANPELYQVMHGLGGVPFGTVATPEEARATFTVLRDAFADFLVGSDVAASDLNDVVDLFWGNLHGLVALTMTGRIAGGQERAATLIEPGIHLFLTGLTAQRRDDRDR